MPRPIVWSVAGLDTGGGAGLSADQRMAEACGVHLCPVAAALTAQNSVAVTRVQAVEPGMLEAQLAALHDDMPPAAIKTGMLGSAENVRVLARCVDRLRERDPGLPLIVDPVLRASTGAALADETLLAAYVQCLLPRTTVVTPNRSEAAWLLGGADAGTPVPAQAAALQSLGARTVCITGGDATGDGSLALDWLATHHAHGWLAGPRVETRHSHGSGCSFASAWAAAAARGFVDADAAVLAKMATHDALRHADALGTGPGPVRAAAGFVSDASLLPRLSWDETPPHADAPATPASWVAPGLYAVAHSAEQAAAAARAGASTVQLRIKNPTHTAALRTAIADAQAAARAAGALLYVNDHWRLAIELGTDGVHLGQEDLQSLDAHARAALRAARSQGLRLGVSSHSLWELARAASLRPDYIACGPVWPTTTKAMPWRAQGLHNLAWWVRMAGAPVVAIGGVLAPEQAEQLAHAGAAGVCIVRALGEEPDRTVPRWLAAWRAGLARREADANRAPTLAPPPWPLPSLPRPFAARGRCAGGA